MSVGSGLPLHSVGPVARVEVAEVDEATRERVGAARGAIGTPRRAVPAVIGEAAARKVWHRCTEGQALVPLRATVVILGGEAAWLAVRLEEGRDARRELQRSHDVRILARVADRALEHIKLGGTATLERIEPFRLEVAVVARADALRGLRGRQPQVSVALAVRPRPQAGVRVLVDGAAEVAEEPQRRPVAPTPRLARTELDDATGEAELVPRLEHRRTGRHVDALLASRRLTRKRLIFRQNLECGYRLELKRRIGGIANVRDDRCLLRQVVGGALVGRVANVERRPLRVMPIGKVAALFLKLVGEDQLHRGLLRVDETVGLRGGLRVAPAASSTLCLRGGGLRCHAHSHKGRAEARHRSRSEGARVGMRARARLSRLTRKRYACRNAM